MNAFVLIIALLGAWFGHANQVAHIPGVVFFFPAALLWLGLNAATLKRAFRNGWICGSLCYAACLYWLVIPLDVYGGFPFLLALPAPILLGMYLGLYAGMFAAIIFWLRTRRLPSPLLGLGVGLLWGGMEMAQGTLFTGFSWLTLAAAMAPWPAAIQALAWVGEYWQSALFATCTAWLALGLTLGRQGRQSLVLGVAASASLLIWGAWAVNTPLAKAPSVRVALIQGNIDQGVKWDKAYQEHTVQEYIQLTRRELQPRPDLVVWPETAMPFYLQEDNALSRQVRGFVRDNQLLLLTGAIRYTVNSATGEVTYANSAFLLGPTGETLALYDKEHLVPFGEYVPFGDLFPFIPRLVHGDAEFIPGNDPSPLRWENLALGILICYEIIFPNLSQDRVQAGANLLVTISNDAWFGLSSAPRQHLHQAVLRAVEQGRFVVRSTNTGITAVIDPRGRRLETGTLFQRLTMSYSGVRLLEEATFFHRHYLTLKVALPLTVCVVLLVAWARRPRPGTP
jgi:apolipoprotein N-acyltransferase